MEGTEGKGEDIVRRETGMEERNEGCNGFLLRDGDTEGRERGNAGRKRERKGGEEPVLPIKNRPRAPSKCLHVL